MTYKFATLTDFQKFFTAIDMIKFLTKYIQNFLPYLYVPGEMQIFKCDTNCAEIIIKF